MTSSFVGSLSQVGTTELGLWLERVLHMPNDTKGDSPKAAGMLELLCTQGHWGASVRWTYQDLIAGEATEASGGAPLSKTAPNTAPSVAWQQARARSAARLQRSHPVVLDVAHKQPEMRVPARAASVSPR